MACSVSSSDVAGGGGDLPGSLEVSNGDLGWVEVVELGEQVIVRDAVVGGGVVEVGHVADNIGLGGLAANLGVGLELIDDSLDDIGGELSGSEGGRKLGSSDSAILGGDVGRVENGTNLGGDGGLSSSAVVLLGEVLLGVGGSVLKVLPGDLGWVEVLDLVLDLAIGETLRESVPVDEINGVLEIAPGDVATSLFLVLVLGSADHLVGESTSGHGVSELLGGELAILVGVHLVEDATSLTAGIEVLLGEELDSLGGGESESEGESAHVDVLWGVESVLFFIITGPDRAPFIVPRIRASVKFLVTFGF